MTRAFTHIKRAWRATARRRGTVALAVGGLILAARAALLPVWKIPTPSVPDEFSHLLLGDTLVLGRVTNPTHPMWQHFETAYVLQRPTYNSAYAPAQGVVLAAGKMLAGHPWWGVWFSAGIMCCALCWMLQQWLPPEWALAGAIWASLQIGLTTYWINSYWGGAVAATGGALVLGGAGRLRRKVSRLDSIVMASGLGILAASRPYEGGVFGAAMLIYAAWGLLRKKKRVAARTSPMAAILPGAVLLFLIAGALAYYCWRVTGSPFTPPQYLYARQYAFTKIFVWQKTPPPPVIRHPVLREQMRFFLLEQKQFDTFRGAMRITLVKAVEIGGFYFGPLMLVPLIMMPWLVRGRLRGVVLAGACTMAAIFVTIPLELHYAAPLAGVFYLLTLEALRTLWDARRRGNWVGVFLITAAPLIVLATIDQNASPPQARPAHMARAALLRNLERTHEKHLIIVRYSSPHQLADEWVYNDADIDRSPVVWARDMGPQNAELIRYFHGRKIWFLDADSLERALTPLTSSGDSDLH